MAGLADSIPGIWIVTVAVPVVVSWSCWCRSRVSSPRASPVLFCVLNADGGLPVRSSRSHRFPFCICPSSCCVESVQQQMVVVKPPANLIFSIAKCRSVGRGSTGVVFRIQKGVLSSKHINFRCRIRTRTIVMLGHFIDVACFVLFAGQTLGAGACRQTRRPLCR